MGFMVSPGVDVKEIDLTNVIPAVSTSIGGTIGLYNWGPIDEIVQVGSEQDLVTRFGKPDDTTYPYFYNAALFLKYGNALKVVRYGGDTSDTTLLNATGGSAGLLVKNVDHYDSLATSIEAGDATNGRFIARCAGSAGNGLKVTIITSGSFLGDNSGTGSSFAGLFEAAPEAGNFHIVVQDEGGDLADGATSTNPVTLETFANVSASPTAKADTGGSNFYYDVLKKNSAFIFAGHKYQASEVNATITSDITVSLGNGGNYTTGDGTEAGIAGTYGGNDGIFADAESVDVNFFIAGAMSSANSNTVIAAAETRKDVIAFASPPVADVSNRADTTTAVNAAKTWADSINSSSYGVLDSASVYIYDKYNDKNRFTGAAGLVAGLNAYTDDVADPWFSPAGFNRGQLRSVIKLSYNPTSTQRDTLYKARINPLVSFPGQGTVLFGDKTALSKPSAFDRINVRRLFITIEKAIATAAKFQLFEFNDEFTRAMFRNMTEPFLREVKGRRGITDFAVICDETNNTGNIIDTNQFVADIYVKPARSINFITLNFIATRTGIEFSEIIGK